MMVNFIVFTLLTNLKIWTNHAFISFSFNWRYLTHSTACTTMNCIYLRLAQYAWFLFLFHFQNFRLEFFHFIHHFIKGFCHSIKILFFHKSFDFEWRNQWRFYIFNSWNVRLKNLILFFSRGKFVLQNFYLLVLFINLLKKILLRSFHLCLIFFIFVKLLNKILIHLVAILLTQ